MMLSSSVFGVCGNRDVWCVVLLLLLPLSPARRSFVGSYVRCRLVVFLFFVFSLFDGF